MYEVYALHVGDRETTRCQFLYRDASHAPLTISFYFWLVLGGPEPLVIDTTFDEAYAKRRGLSFYRDRAALLRRVGIDPLEIGTVLLSHLHWDHCAGHALFPRSRFLVQKRELVFWNGPIMNYEAIASSGSRDALDAMERPELARRLDPRDGDFALAPGIGVHVVGGHTPGMQILTVPTRRGTVVLANDAMHYYENFERRRPVQVTMDMPGALRALETIDRLAGGRHDLVVPGHDPAVAQRFETVAPGIVRIA